MLETVKPFENLEEIVSAPGLDVTWIGHYDLTVSMGIPGQFEHPDFLVAMDSLIVTCQRYQVAPGFLPASPADTVRWVRKGIRMVSLGSDVGVYLNAIRSFHHAVLDGLPEGK